MSTESGENIENNDAAADIQRVKSESTNAGQSQFSGEETLSNEPDGGCAQAEDDCELIQIWLREKSEHTQRAYQYDIEEFTTYVEKPIQAILLQDILSFRQHLKSRDLSTNTVIRKLGAVKSLFQFADDIGYISFDISKPVSTPTSRRRSNEKLLSVGEVQLIIGGARNTSHPARNEAILRLLYSTGVRRSEIEGLQWRNLDPRPDLTPSRGQITVWGKGGKERTALLTEKAWDCILEWERRERRVGRGSPEDPVFRSQKGGALSASQIYRIVKKAADEAGVQNESVSPHSLRHAHITHALQNGAPVRTIMRTVGHSSMRSTSIYAHVGPNESSSDFLDA